jgi:hemolysin-activating ACP:hemolysin acyltransferase
MAQPAGDSKPPVQELRLTRHQRPSAALGLAVMYLMTKPAFASLKFGELSRALVGQIERKHYCFVLDDKDEIQGFLGWAITSRVRAEDWVEGRAGLSSVDSVEGDCMIINAWAATSQKVNRILLAHVRKVGAGKDMVYFKRYYNDGTNRPARLRVNDFVARHLERTRPPAEPKEPTAGS